MKRGKERKEQRMSLEIGNFFNEKWPETYFVLVCVTHCLMLFVVFWVSKKNFNLWGTICVDENKKKIKKKKREKKCQNHQQQKRDVPQDNLKIVRFKTKIEEMKEIKWGKMYMIKKQICKHPQLHLNQLNLNMHANPIWKSRNQCEKTKCTWKC